MYILVTSPGQLLTFLAQSLEDGNHTFDFAVSCRTMCLPSYPLELIYDIHPTNTTICHDTVNTRLFKGSKTIKSGIVYFFRKFASHERKRQFDEWNFECVLFDVNLRGKWKLIE